MSEDAKAIVEAINEVASRYAQKNNESSGAEQMIYGEICDALRDIAEHIEGKLDK